jgi:hypothetical protein
MSAWLTLNFLGVDRAERQTLRLDFLADSYAGGPEVVGAGLYDARRMPWRMIVARLRVQRLVVVSMTIDERRARAMETVTEGEEALIGIRFASVGGAPLVVDGVDLRARPPAGGALRSYLCVPGPVAGEWEAKVLFDVPGRWWLEGECTSPARAISPSLVVNVRPRTAV